MRDLFDIARLLSSMLMVSIDLCCCPSYYCSCFFFLLSWYRVRSYFLRVRIFSLIVVVFVSGVG